MNRDSAACCVARLGVVFGILGGAACGSDAPVTMRQPIAVTVRADGVALAGATVWVGAERRGLTGADGLVRTAAVGPVGLTVGLTVDCPVGHHLAQPPASFVLGRGDSTQSGTHRVEVECARDRAQAVVLVRGSGRVSESVRLDGREVARLDAEGLAHVLVAMAPRTRFEVEVGGPLPERVARATFTMPLGEDVFVFDVPPPPAPPPVAPPRVRGGRGGRVWTPMPLFVPRSERPR